MGQTTPRRSHTHIEIRGTHHRSTIVKGELQNGLNRYTIVKILGKGRRGQTLLAQATTPPSTPVVIKQLYRPQEPIETVTQRLRAVGQHPQLPTLKDGWQTPNGQFLAFDYISHPPIHQAEPPPWSPSQLETCLLSLLPVLEYLHSFRLVHGDIRPDNIRHGPQHPILVDLRITQRLTDSPLSTTGGDATYAAPEQTLGQLVYASDLYSLGLVAIHLLTGLSPFDLYSIADNRWIWPDLVATPLPKSLSTVLHKLLQRALQDRYTTANQVITDLKKSSTHALLDRARTLVPPQVTQPLQAALAKAKDMALAPSATPALSGAAANLIQWKPCHQITLDTIATAIALQAPILALGTSTGTIRIFEVASGEEMGRLGGRRQGHGDRICALTLQGDILYSASSDGTIKLWDVTQGTLLHTLSQPGWEPTDLTIALPYLIVGDGTGQITLWDLEQLTLEHRFTQHQDRVSAIAARGQRLVSISCDRTLRLWSLSTQRLIKTFPIQLSQALAIHPSGNHVIVGNDQGQVNVWHVGQPARPDQLCQVHDSITALALSPDARLLAVGTGGNILRVYQGASGQCVSALAQGWGVVAIAFDGHSLVSSSQDETITIWQKKS